MCGRFTLTSSAQDVARAFALADVPGLRPRYNIAPGQDVAVVIGGEEGTRRLEWQRWGLVPSWAKDPAIGQRTINARSETVAEKPAFRSAFRRRRCLVPADGFFEWSGPRSARRPHWFQVGGEVFAIAGLYEHWVAKEPREDAPPELWTCTLLTTEANAVVRPLHHRMPVILDPRDHATWLDPDFEDREALAALLVPFPPDRMQVREVGVRVNDVRNDDPGCVAAAE